MSKRSIEAVETVEEEAVAVETVVVEEKKAFFKIAYRNTKLKQLFVEGTAKADFVVIDTLNNTEVGHGKTNANGEAICICERLNDKVKVIKR